MQPTLESETEPPDTSHNQEATEPQKAIAQERDKARRRLAGSSTFPGKIQCRFTVAGGLK
jgi:hypothetical protein